MRPVQALTHYWDVGTLAWVKGTQPAGGGGGAATIADGADVALGATTDAAVITDTTGTISGKLRGLVKWAFERMPASLGQKAMAASFPVTWASDQTHTPAIVTSTGTMSATNDPVTVTLNGHTGVGARVVASGTFDGLVLMEASWNNGANYADIQFVVVATGGVVEGVAFVGGLYAGTADHHFSALLPAGITHVRIRNSTVTSGSIAVTLNATSQLDFSQRYTGAEAQIPPPGQAVQLGGSASLAGEFKSVRAQAVNPGISATAIGLVVTPWGLVEPGASATGYPFRLVGGRDPTSNAFRQMDLYPGVLSSTGWNGVVVRPYQVSDGAGNQEPIKRNSDTAAYYRDGHQSPVALAFKVFHEPAANTQATITQASAGAGKRNVCTGITVTLASDGTAPAAVQLYVRLRDGGTGAGTVLWSSVIALTAVAGAMVNIERNNIWIEGSQATAMTLEFSAAGGANTIETVSMEGVILTE